jgi:hypothetical protein
MKLVGGMIDVQKFDVMTCIRHGRSEPVRNIAGAGEVLCATLSNSARRTYVIKCVEILNAYKRGPLSVSEAGFDCVIGPRETTATPAKRGAVIPIVR